MKSNCNIDVKLNADKVLDVFGAGLRKCIDKIAGKDSGGSGGGRGQGSGGSRDGYGSGAQRRGGRRSRW